MRELTVHIDRLVLEGVPFSPADHALLGETIQTELARLITARGLEPSHSGALAKVGAPPIAATSEASSLGRQIAASVYAGIGGTRR
jgi:hypothetical protein